MEVKTLQDLRSTSIAVTEPLTVIHPQSGEKSVLKPYESKDKNITVKMYAINNGIISFVFQGVLYVIPYTSSVMHILWRSGFSRSDIPVPFSNWDYPIKYEAKWNGLIKWAHEEHLKEFVRDCNRLSDQLGYKEISSNLFDKCFEIPSSGLLVRPIANTNTKRICRPLIDSAYLGKEGAELLGHYAVNNGVCVFVYRNGKTFLTRSWEVVTALRNAGYVEGNMSVPFSNGEIIDDPDYAHRWENLPA